MWTAGIFFLILVADLSSLDAIDESLTVVKSFIEREANKFERVDFPHTLEESIRVRLRRFLSPMGRNIAQPWLPTLIAQEEKDRNQRAKVQKKREKSEWKERSQRRERDLSAERQERANFVEREWRGWRGERHMQFERQERAERQDRGARDQVGYQQWRGVLGSRNLREEEQEQSDTEERMERNERATREERNKRVSMVDRYLREAIATGREQRAIKNFNHASATETKLGSRGYHIAEPEVAVGDTSGVDDNTPFEDSSESQEISMDDIDSEEETWHTLKLY